MTINIKNDAPESVLVKAMLTITTYGWNLLDKKSLIKEAEYREIFKQNVLNGHKSLLESELAQMYIRHAIKDGNMCPYTGAQCKTPRPIEKDEDGNAPGATDTQKDNAAFQSAYGVRTAQECSQCPIMQKSCAIQSSCPPAIIHQIRREDMSMSGQASNLTFSDSAIQRAVIERVFDERKKYLIIALTGKIGAGSSYVSSFIQKASNGEEIPCSSSECNNYSSDEERADNILLRYFECNRIPFHVIRVRDVITSFIVENDAWARLAVWQQNIKKAESDIMRLLHGKLKRLLYNIVLQPGGGDAFIDGKKVGRNEAETLNSSVRRMLSGWDKKRSPKLLTEYNRDLKKSNLERRKELEIRNYVLYILY